MMLLSGSAGITGVATGLSVVFARFELILSLPMAAGVAVLEAAVLVRAWAAYVAPAQAGKADHPAPSMRTGGANDGVSGRNMTWWKT